MYERTLARSLHACLGRRRSRPGSMPPHRSNASYAEGGGVWVRREINLYLFYFHLSLSVLTDVPLECGASQRCCFLSMLGCTGTWNPTTAGVVAINPAWNERDGRTVFDAQISIT